MPAAKKFTKRELRRFSRTCYVLYGPGELVTEEDGGGLFYQTENGKSLWISSEQFAPLFEDEIPPPIWCNRTLWYCMAGLAGIVGVSAWLWW